MSCFEARLSSQTELDFPLSILLTGLKVPTPAPPLRTGPGRSSQALRPEVYEQKGGFCLVFSFLLLLNQQANRHLYFIQNIVCLFGEFGMA